MNIPLRQFARECAATQVIAAGPEAMITGISHDTRSLKPGDLFVCLQGASHRGEEYLPEAAARGASAALVGEGHDNNESPTSLPLIKAEDSLAALRAYAIGRRGRFGGRCTAITGSVGKTTTKDLLAQILAHTGASVNASLANQNNELGLWLTLARLSDDSEHLVVEMGARRRGDIAFLAGHARPDVGLISAIKAVHMRTFADIDEIVDAKAELYEALAPDSCAVVNADIAEAEALIARISCHRLVLYSTDAEAGERRIGALNESRRAMGLAPAEIEIGLFEAAVPGRCRIRLAGEVHTLSHRIPAAHNLANLFGAIACARALGVDFAAIAAACGQLAMPPRRLEEIELDGGNLLIDDSYNANPDALLAGLDYALGRRRRLWLIVGELAELGDREETALADLAERLAGRDCARLICVGAQAKALAQAHPTRARCFADRDEALAWLLGQRPARTCLYVKGSRSAGLDQLVDGFIKNSPLCSTN